MRSVSHRWILLSLLLHVVLLVNVVSSIKLNNLLKNVDQQISDSDDDETVQNEFLNFRSLHGKKYDNPIAELKAKLAFSQNRKLIREHNKLALSGKKKFSLALNEFADKTAEELKSILNGATAPEEPVERLEKAPPPHVKNIHGPRGRRSITVPGYANYTAWGYTTPVLYQGSCGCCWAMTAAAVLETHMAFYTGQITPISTQNLIDCSTSYGTNGCKSGWPAKAFSYIKDNGVEADNSYPFSGTLNQCSFDSSRKLASNVCVSSVSYLPAGNEDELVNAVYNQGPIAVAINADSHEFMYYKEGVYTDDSCSKTVTHAVTITGYGTEADGTPYYIVKNSWGSGWGENGYVRFARNNNNQCAIASWGHFPNLAAC